MDGFINLDKPRGMTSNAALGRVKALLRERYGKVKAGFIGTLDPMAEGVLVIALGAATKAIPLLEGGRKEYEFKMSFEFSTDTLDADGTMLERSERVPTNDEILGVLPRFVGKIQQVPPAYSALKIAGTRAYELARRGEEVKLAPREQEVFALSYLDGLFHVEADRGFYVRALARDIAESLGAKGHITYLKRLRCGRFAYGDTISLDKMAEKLQNQAGTDDNSFAIGIPEALDGISAEGINEKTMRRLSRLMENLRCRAKEKENGSKARAYPSL